MKRQTKTEKLETMIQLLRGKINFYEDEMDKCIPQIRHYQESRMKREILQKELKKNLAQKTKIEILDKIEKTETNHTKEKTL